MLLAHVARTVNVVTNASARGKKTKESPPLNRNWTSLLKMLKPSNAVPMKTALVE
jgi:hypothetical protein